MIFFSVVVCSCDFAEAQSVNAVCVFASPTGLTDADVKKLRLGRSVVIFSVVA